MASLRLRLVGFTAVALSSSLVLVPSCSGVNGDAGTTTTGGTSGGQTYYPTGTGGTPVNQFVFDLPECTVVPPAGCEGWSTRYWDCCKPHCAWPSNTSYTTGVAQSCSLTDQAVANSVASGCDGGTAYACWGMAPWAVNEVLSYGFAASTEGSHCGRCFQLDFKGYSYNDDYDQGSRGLCGKSMIVQVTNVGSDVEPGQFDIMIPGGGVGAFNGCSVQWNATAAELGAQYGGFMTTCRVDVVGIRRPLAEYQACVRERCVALFESRGLRALADGCYWYVDWFYTANNPALVYREVQCPAELTARSGILAPSALGGCL